MSKSLFIGFTEKLLSFPLWIKQTIYLDLTRDLNTYLSNEFLDVQEDELYHMSFQSFLEAIQSVIDDGTWESDDVCDIDGYVGDCIIQYAAFGEVIYG